MAAIQHRQLFALGLLDERFSPANSILYTGEADAESSYTESGKVPSGTTPPANSQLRVWATGALDNTLDVQADVVRAGLPGTVEVAYNAYTGSANDRRAWSTPFTIFDWLPVVWSTTPTDLYGWADATVLSDGTIVAVYQGRSSDGDVTTKTWNPVSRVWGNQQVLPIEGEACVCALPDGSVLLMAVASSVAGTIYRSTDKAVTWEVAGYRVIDRDFDNFARMVYSRGNVALLTDDGTDTITQFASSDLGGTFALVVESAIGEMVSATVLPSGVIVVGYLALSGQPCVRLLGSAFASIADAEEIEIDSTIDPETQDTDGLSVVAEPDGTLWFYWSSEGILRAFVSINGGLSWLAVPDHVADPTQGVTIKELCAVYSAGEVHLLHSFNPADDNFTVGDFRLGGWYSLSAGRAKESTAVDRRIDYGIVDRMGVASSENENGWGITYIPADSPVTLGWTATGAGTGSLASDGTWDITTSSNALYYTKTSSILWLDARAICCVRIVSGGSVADTRSLVRLQVGDGAARYRLDLRMSTTQVALVDGEAGTTLATATVSTTTDLYIAFQIANMPGAIVKGRAWYRRSAGYGWTEIGSGPFTLTSTASANTNLIEWGSRTSSTVNMRFRLVSAGGTEVRGLWQFPSDDEQPSKAIGRIPIPIPDYGGDDVRAHLVAGGGPGRIGEAHILASRGARPYAASWPANNASSREGARFDSGSQSFAWEASGVELPSLIALATIIVFRHVNFHYVTWNTYEADGTEVEVDVEFESQLIGACVIVGDCATVTLSRYAREGEFEGATILFDGTPVTRRKIRWNTAGGSASTPMQIWFDGADGTEDGTDCAIWPHSFAVVIYGEQDPLVAIYKLTIPGEASADGDVRLGSMGIYRAVVPGLPPSWTDTEGREAVIEREELPRGGVRQKKLQEPLRRVSVSWQDPAVDQLCLSVTDPDYVAPADTDLALTSVGDVHRILQASLAYAHLPVVAIRNMPAESGVINVLDEWIEGYWSSGIQANLVQRDHNLDVNLGATWRTEGVTIEERP